MKSYSLPCFDKFTSAKIITLIQYLKPNWQGFWLHNTGNDVIGILPKISWILSQNPDGIGLAFILTTQHRNQNSNQTNHQDANQDNTVSKNPITFNNFEKILIDYHQKYTHQHITDTDRYHHGLMGYISYDISANRLNHAITMQSTPLAYFGHYDIYLAYVDHHWQLCVAGDDSIAIDDLFNIFNKIANTPLPTPSPIALHSAITQDDYRTVFDKTIDYLKAGDAYQINLTQAWQANSDTPLYYHLPKLFGATYAPFSGFVMIDEFEVLSVSPELFFKFNQQDTNILLTTKPIKGTRPRSTNPQDDERLKHELATSEKDLAENVMIVDLLRNDLGKYAKFGAVSVPVRFAIESFSNVHHMVSTVVATLDDPIKTPILKVLFDSLPAGSITGSPKKRACEIIHELEYAPRGAYCGTMGYLNFNNTGQWNVLIRTAQAYHTNGTRHVRLWAGGGITVLSDCDDEYQECLDKIGHIKTLLSKS